MIPLLNDPKPTVVRQCLASLHEVVLYLPEMTDDIAAAVSEIDLSQYKDSMSPLIKKDADELLKIIGVIIALATVIIVAKKNRKNDYHRQSTCTNN